MRYRIGCYFIDDNDVPIRVSRNGYFRLARGVDRLARFANRRVRYAKLVIEMDGPVPTGAVYGNYELTTFDSEGHLDRDVVLRRMALEAHAESGEPLAGVPVFAPDGDSADRMLTAEFRWMPQVQLRRRLIALTFDDRRWAPGRTIALE